MRISVRPRRPTEGRVFLEIHSHSIRGVAIAHYPPEVIKAWAIPLNEENVREFHENPDAEIRLIAEPDGEPVKLGVLVVPNSELRACYVVGEAARKGVGTALVREIERVATDNGVERLELARLINAEPFCAYLGCGSGGRTEHVLRNGQPMFAVRMTKRWRNMVVRGECW